MFTYVYFVRGDKRDEAKSSSRLVVVVSFHDTALFVYVQATLS
jgi:hypothetical protein